MAGGAPTSDGAPVTYADHPDPTVDVPCGWVHDPATLAGIDRAVRDHLPVEAAADLGPLLRAFHHRPGGFTVTYDGGRVFWRSFAARFTSPGEEDRWWHLGRLLAPGDVARYVGPWGRQP